MAEDGYRASTFQDYWLRHGRTEEKPNDGVVESEKLYREELLLSIKKTNYFWK